MDTQSIKPSKGWDEWMTDPTWIELIRTSMKSIDFDPCSNIVAQQYVKAKTFCVHPSQYKVTDVIKCDILEDGLSQQWKGNVFCNPPYSKGNIDAFTDKALYEWNERNAYLDDDHYTKDNPYVNQMMILVNSATDAKWYHSLLNASSATLLVKGRIKFWKIMDGKAYDKWEGVKSKEKGLNKIGNSPRYLNTLFYFGNNIERFNEVFSSKGIIIMVKT